MSSIASLPHWPRAAEAQREGGSVRTGNDVTAFTTRGFRAREFFRHEVLWVPKPYPNTHAGLERRGVSQRRVAAGEFVQINVYSDWLAGLPDEVFTDRAINWHAQQFGNKGLIAAAGLFIEGQTAFVTYLQSDLCQQIYRSATLKRAASAKLDRRFGYWYLVLFNAILDFACDRGLETVYSPTSQSIAAATTKHIVPALFDKIYGSVGERYECRREVIGRAEYWRVGLASNEQRIARLNEHDGHAGEAGAVGPETSRKVICICHDIEEDADTAIAPEECREALDKMLAIERAHGVFTTYSVLGRLFRDKAPVILCSGSHSLAFHSYDHQIGGHTQLAQVRQVDLQVRGYRPPQSKITKELSDYALGARDFEWLLSSARSLNLEQPAIERGIVKIPVHLDDWPMQSGAMTREQWIERLRDEIRTRDFVAVGLHDCYARHWIDWYPELLEELKQLGELWTCDQVVNRERFRSALSAGQPATTQTPTLLQRWSLADCLTISRMACAPLLLGAAAGGFTGWVYGIAVYGLVSDTADGQIARYYNNTTPRGARLDSIADLAFNWSLMASLVILFPERFLAEWARLATVVVAYAVPIVGGWYKFGRLTAYHTTLNRVAMPLVVAGVLLWLWFDTLWPVQAGIVVMVIAAFEELLITWRLERIRDNVSTVFKLFEPNSQRSEACVPKNHER